MVEAVLVILELLFVAAVVAGIAMIFVPAAFIVGGLLGVVVVEHAGRGIKR